MTVERHVERATLATYYDQLEGATNTALDLIRAARSLPGGGRRLLPSGRVVVTRDVGDARDGAVVRPRLAVLLTAMTEDLPPPPPASPQTLPVPGGPLPHATREEEEEAASPPVPQVPPPEPPSVHASAHHGATPSPQVSSRLYSAGASVGACKCSLRRPSPPTGTAARLVCAGVDVGGGHNGGYWYRGRSNRGHQTPGCRPAALPDRVAGERCVAASAGWVWSGATCPSAPTMAPADAPRVRHGRRGGRRQ